MRLSNLRSGDLFSSGAASIHMLAPEITAPYAMMIHPPECKALARLTKLTSEPTIKRPAPMVAVDWSFSLLLCCEPSLAEGWRGYEWFRFQRSPCMPIPLANHLFQAS